MLRSYGKDKRDGTKNVTPWGAFPPAIIHLGSGPVHVGLLLQQCPSYCAAAAAHVNILQSVRMQTGGDISQISPHSFAR